MTSLHVFSTSLTTTTIQEQEEVVIKKCLTIINTYVRHWWKMRIEHKKTKTKLYNFRISDDDSLMIKYIKDMNVNLSSMLRKHIKEIYDSVSGDTDDNMYRP